MAHKSRHIRLGGSYRTAQALLRQPMMRTTRRDWRGAENLGAHGQGIIVAPNHVSWFDPLVVAHYLFDNGRPPRFMAKQAVFDVAVVGRIIDGAGQIPVIRDEDPTQSLAAALKAVRDGECLVVYPEGTITRDPDLWPMTGKTGALRIALETGQPLIPIAQWGAQEIMPPYEKRLRLFPRKTMQVIAGPPLNIDDLRDRPVTRELLDEGTNRLMDAITALLETLRGEKAPEQRLDWAAEKRRRAEQANAEED
jgi:1-acyl-sn-glycerol-3-phosphate acyltransferase